MNHCQELAPFLWLVVKATHLSAQDYVSLYPLQKLVSNGCLSFFLSEKDDFCLWENLIAFFQRGSSAVPELSAQGSPVDHPPMQAASTAQPFLFNFFRDVWEATGLLMRILEGSPFTQSDEERNEKVFEDFLNAFVNGCLESKLSTLEAVRRVVNNDLVFRRSARAEFFRFSLYTESSRRPALEPHHLLKHALHTMLLTCSGSLTGPLFPVRPRVCQVLSEVVTKPRDPSDPGLGRLFRLLETTARVFAGTDVEREDMEAFLRLYFPSQMHTPGWALRRYIRKPGLSRFWSAEPAEERFVSYPGPKNYDVLYSFAEGFMFRLVQAPGSCGEDVPRFSAEEAVGFLRALTELVYTSFYGGLPLNLGHFQGLFRACPDLALPWLVELGHKSHDVEARGSGLGLRIGVNRLVLELVRELVQVRASQNCLPPGFFSAWISRESSEMQMRNFNPFASLVFRGAPQLVRSQLKLVIVDSLLKVFGAYLETERFAENVADFLDIDSFQTFLELCQT